MGVGIRMCAEDMERLRHVNAHRGRIPVAIKWPITEAYRQLEGLAHAVQGGASDAIVLNEAADVGNLCQMIAERYVMP